MAMSEVDAKAPVQLPRLCATGASFERSWISLRTSASATSKFGSADTLFERLDL
jgi:hypothetical protein